MLWKSIDFIPRQNCIVSSSRDGSVIIWDLGSSQLKLMIAKLGQINAIRLNPDGSYLACANNEGVIYIFDVDPNRTHGQRVTELEKRMVFTGMKIGGALGLEEKTYRSPIVKQIKRSTLLEFFAENGAVLDASQKVIIKAKSKIKSREDTLTSQRKTVLVKGEAKRSKK